MNLDFLVLLWLVSFTSCDHFLDDSIMIIGDNVHYINVFHGRHFIKFGYLINYEKIVGFTAYIIEILKM